MSNTAAKITSNLASFCSISGFFFTRLPFRPVAAGLVLWIGVPSERLCIAFRPHPNPQYDPTSHRASLHHETHRFPVDLPAFLSRVANSSRHRQSTHPASPDPASPRATGSNNHRPAAIQHRTLQNRALKRPKHADNRSRSYR